MFFFKCLDVLIVLNALFTIKIMLIEDIKADIEEWPHVKKKAGKPQRAQTGKISSILRKLDKL
jgi:hypothetical protein